MDTNCSFGGSFSTPLTAGRLVMTLRLMKDLHATLCFPHAMTMFVVTAAQAVMIRAAYGSAANGGCRRATPAVSAGGRCPTNYARRDCGPTKPADALSATFSLVLLDCVR